jgi:hypothetical protein
MPIEKKMVQISEDELSSLTERLDSLEKQSKPARVSKRVTEHTATLRVWNNKIVHGVKRVYEELNERTQKEVTKAEIILLDDKGEQTLETVGYMKFLDEAERIMVSLIERHIKEKITVEGSSSKLDRKTDRYLDQEVDFVVTTMITNYKVKVISDGKFKNRELSLPETSLNM